MKTKNELKNNKHLRKKLKSWKIALVGVVILWVYAVCIILSFIINAENKYLSLGIIYFILSLLGIIFIPLLKINYSYLMDRKIDKNNKILIKTSLGSLMCGIMGLFVISISSVSYSIVPFLSGLILFISFIYSGYEKDFYFYV